MRKTHLREYLDQKKTIVITACGCKVSKARKMTDEPGKVTCSRCKKHAALKPEE